MLPQINGNRVVTTKSLFGFGHTHGDYHNDLGHRTPKRLDVNNADEFSQPPFGSHKLYDVGYMKMRYAKDGWTFFTLGTPSGHVLQWSPQDRTTRILFQNSF